MNSLEYNMQDYMEDIYLFNKLSGQFNKTDKANIENQIKMIEEEVKELREAFADNDAVEVVDAVADILFVVIGLQQKLELLKCNMSGAYEEVSNNNLSKFPDKERDAIDTVNMYAEKGITTRYEPCGDQEGVLAGEGYFVVRDQNEKVRKPHYFKACNLEEFVPYNLRKDGFNARN